MNPRQLSGRGWLATGIGAALLVVVAAWFLVISPTRSDTAELELSTADVNAQNAVLATKVADLSAQAEQRDELADELSAALAGLPPGTQLPVLNRQLADQAAARGVELTGFSVGAALAANATGTDAAAASQPAASAELVAIPVTVTSSGPALDQLYFLRDVQQVGPRLALVTATSMTPGQGSESNSITDSSTLTVQLTVFTHRLDAATRDQLADLRGSGTTN